MNSLVWIGQIVLACVFFYAGAAKLFAFKHLGKRLEARTGVPIAMTPAQAKIVGVVEIVGALGVIVPADFTPEFLTAEHLLIRLAAGGLALLMVGAGVYHIRRKESAAPSISAFLLAVFVIIGRWPA